MSSFKIVPGWYYFADCDEDGDPRLNHFELEVSRRVGVFSLDLFNGSHL